ncbi:MAG: FecR domain-containing protein, partial [Planctomycetota bacterium]
PIDIEFTPQGERRLAHGQLVAKVSPEDTGFTIDTPTVKLIDLGTEFGLSTDANGGSEIHVFKGAVEARPRFVDQATDVASITMLTGEANRFATNETPVRQIAFNPKRFSRAWRLSSRVSETTGTMRFVHPAPTSVAEGHTESNETLLLFLERERQMLTDTLPVTVTEPGLYTTFTDRIAWLPAGVEVDSYLVHFDPVGSKSNQAPVSVRGTVTFDRPILGLIARGDQLTYGDSGFASPRTQYIAEPIYHPKKEMRYDLSNISPGYAIRGLTGLWNKHYSHESPAPTDWLRLSADRKTLTLKCAAGGEADQLRILVATDDRERAAVIEAPVNRSTQPFHGKPFVVEQTIEAEDFDLGGQDVAYYDTTPDSLANVYRPGESVELRSYLICDRTDINVSVARAGEWLNYTVEIDKPGLYVVKASAGSMLKGGMFRFEFGETATSHPAITSSLAVPITQLEMGDRADWYGTAVSSPVELKAGRQIMRVIMEANHTSGRLGNFDWFRIEPAPANDLAPSATKK